VDAQQHSDVNSLTMPSFGLLQVLLQSAATEFLAEII
jgi:hypothetical protein